MLPFAYSYNAELVATIKDGIDAGNGKPKPKPMPKTPEKSVNIRMGEKHTKSVRALSDAKAAVLKQVGIRLLNHYHTLVRAHALRHGRIVVDDSDIEFLRAVDSYISISDCKPLS